MKTLKIDEKKCTACGTCLAFAAYITEGENGKAKVIPGKKLRAEDVKNAQEMAELCPEQAIQLQDVNLKRLTAAEKEKLVEGLKKKLSAIEIPMPKESDFTFDEKKYKFTSNICADFIGDLEYRYKSVSAAIDAGWREFKNKYYSQIEQFAMEILSQYGIDKVAKYYDLSENGIYAKWNRGFENVLNKVADQLKNYQEEISLPADFCTFAVFPSLGSGYDVMNPIRFAHYVAEQMNEDEYSDPDWYKRQYIDTDDMTEEEEGFLFNHTKTRYCYKFDYGNICKDFKSDIMSHISDVLSDHDDFYPDYVGYRVEDYQKEVKNMIEEKCKILSDALGYAYQKEQTGMLPPWIKSK